MHSTHIHSLSHSLPSKRATLRRRHQRECMQTDAHTHTHTRTLVNSPSNRATLRRRNQRLCVRLTRLAVAHEACFTCTHKRSQCVSAHSVYMTCASRCGYAFIYIFTGWVCAVETSITCACVAPLGVVTLQTTCVCVCLCK